MKINILLIWMNATSDARVEMLSVNLILPLIILCTNLIAVMINQKCLLWVHLHTTIIIMSLTLTSSKFMLPRKARETLLLLIFIGIISERLWTFCLINSQEVLMSKSFVACIMSIMDTASLIEWIQWMGLSIGSLKLLIKWIQWMGLSIGSLKLFTITLLRMILFLCNGMEWPSQIICLGLSEKTSVTLNCMSDYMEISIIMDQSRYQYVLSIFQQYFIVTSCLHELPRILLVIEIN